jgi:hypothetical protein
MSGGVLLIGYIGIRMYIVLFIYLNLNIQIIHCIMHKIIVGLHSGWGSRYRMVVEFTTTCAISAFHH